MTKAAKSAAKPKPVADDAGADFEDIGYASDADDDLGDTITRVQPDEMPSTGNHDAASNDDASSPMSLADVNAILADNYPGYTPTDPRGTSGGLQFTLPDGKSINVQRKRVKACANMEELRAYVGGLL